MIYTYIWQQTIPVGFSPVTIGFRLQYANPRSTIAFFSWIINLFYINIKLGLKVRFVEFCPEVYVNFLLSTIHFGHCVSFILLPHHVESREVWHSNRSLKAFYLSQVIFLYNTIDGQNLYLWSQMQGKSHNCVTAKDIDLLNHCSQVEWMAYISDE
jgi:hypothetical protein